MKTAMIALAVTLLAGCAIVPLAPYDAVVGGPGYGYNSGPGYGYPPPAYGYSAPAYGYTAPAYGYGYAYYGPQYYPATFTVVIMAEGAMLTVVMGIGGNRRRAAPGGVPMRKKHTGPCAREVTEPQRTDQGAST